MSMSSWKESAKFWKSLPRRSLLIFLGGVFCLFGSLALVISIMNGATEQVWVAMVWVASTGGLAVMWAWCGVYRKIKPMIALFPVQFLSSNVLGWLLSWSGKPPADAASVHQRSNVEGSGALALIVAGYVLFILFFRREGRRYFAAHTEIALAGEIHRSLVPEVSRRIGDFEIYGISAASGEVGGDLVDLIESGGGWVAYIADVSGHGVPAGVLMGMVKSAARMHLSSANGTGEFLECLNAVLKPIAAPHMYATVGYLKCDAHGEIRLSLAGHPPLLHYQDTSKSVVEETVENFPLAMLPDIRFASRILAVAPGDTLALLTDGIIETFDARERELGIEPLKAILTAGASQSLNVVAAAIRERALRHGPQVDDQTVLLVRRLRGASTPTPAGDTIRLE